MIGRSVSSELFFLISCLEVYFHWNILSYHMGGGLACDPRNRLVPKHRSSQNYQNLGTSPVLFFISQAPAVPKFSKRRKESEGKKINVAILRIWEPAWFLEKKKRDFAREWPNRVLMNFFVQVITQPCISRILNHSTIFIRLLIIKF